MVKALTLAPPTNSSVAPLRTVTPPAPAGPASSNVPPETIVPPVYVLAPVNSTVPPEAASITTLPEPEVKFSAVGLPSWSVMMSETSVVCPAAAPNVTV
jgi:hypothetical protein